MENIPPKGYKSNILSSNVMFFLCPGDALHVTGGSETSDEWMDVDNSDDNIESVFM